MTFEQQKRRWPGIVEWCKVMGSYEYYLRNELNFAEETNAPTNAISQSRGVWKTWDEIENQDLQYIKELKSE